MLVYCNLIVYVGVLHIVTCVCVCVCVCASVYAGVTDTPSLGIITVYLQVRQLVPKTEQIFKWIIYNRNKKTTKHHTQHVSTPHNTVSHLIQSMTDNSNLILKTTQA